MAEIYICEHFYGSGDHIGLLGYNVHWKHNKLQQPKHKTDFEVCQLKKEKQKKKDYFIGHCNAAPIHCTTSSITSDDIICHDQMNPLKPHILFVALKPIGLGCVSYHVYSKSSHVCCLYNFVSIRHSQTWLTHDIWSMTASSLLSKCSHERQRCVSKSRVQILQPSHVCKTSSKMSSYTHSHSLHSPLSWVIYSWVFQLAEWEEELSSLPSLLLPLITCNL